MQPLFQGVENGVGFCRRKADCWDAKTTVIGDDTGHIHLGYTGGPRQRQHSHDLWQKARQRLDLSALRPMELKVE